MRSAQGSKTSTDMVMDTSRTTRSKGNLNDASKKPGRSNSGLKKNNPPKKPTKEKNKEVVDIQPMVYSFRVPSNPSPGSVMNALLPPYWLYHDHAFGVLWMLFHQDKKYIGIAQLHWCLRFLLDLKNTDGEYTGDVNVCIQAVQDDLIEQYANLGLALEHQESTKKQRRAASTENNENDNQKNMNKNDNETRAESGSKEDMVSIQENGRENGSSATLLNQRSKMSASSSIDESGYISLTYNEMLSRGPTPYTEQIPLEQIYKAGGTNAAQFPTSTPDIAAMLTSDTSPPDIPLAEMGTEELVSFLNVSRAEHIERIKKEIERLHDLEKFMEGIDKQGFKAYVNDDLARRIDKLDGHGVVKEVDTMLK